MKERVLIAMSGGVDSSVAALLLSKEGYDCAGIMMKLFGDNERALISPALNETTDETADARRVADRLGIPFEYCDCSEEFRKQVMHHFVQAYLDGETPNPCVQCNRTMKFGHLLKEADRLCCSKIATGHYAKISRDASGRFLLSEAADPTKDQTYVLWQLSQEQLSRSLFPLGHFTKEEIRAIALENGFCNAQRKDSQDICFIPDGDYASFLQRYTGETYPDGDFLDLQGNKLGRHRGMIHYTIGQRKGLGVAFGKPTYVCAKCATTNTVILGDDRDLFSKDLTAHSINLIALSRIESPIRVQAKIRYKAKPAWATVEQTDETSFRLRFDEAQRAISPGQSVVLYDGSVVIGGGIIS